MPAIKVIQKTTSEDPDMVEINKLRDEWMSTRRQLDAGALGGTCCVPGCRTMPFVTLKTNLGRRALCLRHFEKLSVETV
jgi:hypothetical protein